MSGAPRQYTSGDALASTTLGTDGSGATTGTRSYRAFGEVRAQTGTLSRFGYTGQQTDAASGLIYLRARYYDPATGRFLTRDPHPGHQARPATKHGYDYVLNNPTRFTDKTGMEPDCSEGACFEPCSGGFCPVPYLKPTDPRYDPKQVAECLAGGLSACSGISDQDVLSYAYCLALGNGDACFHMTQSDIDGFYLCIIDIRCQRELNDMIEWENPGRRFPTFRPTSQCITALVTSIGEMMVGTTFVAGAIGAAIYYGLLGIGGYASGSSCSAS